MKDLNKIKKQLVARKWHALTDVKKFLQSNTKETIESFNGYEIVTKHLLIGLAHGELRVRTKNENN